MDEYPDYIYPNLLPQEKTKNRKKYVKEESQIPSVLF